MHHLSGVTPLSKETDISPGSAARTSALLVFIQAVDSQRLYPLLKSWVCVQDQLVILSAPDLIVHTAYSWSCVDC